MWKVIVIEDDPMLADIHKKYVDSQEAFKCVAVIHDAENALDIIKKQKPDLILLDVYLPHQSGIEFLIKLREEKESVDVILITAARNAEQVETAFRYGAIDYLVKPFEFSRLDQAFETYKSRRAATDGGGVISQEELDRAFGNTYLDKNDVLPKGLNERTLERVKKVIEELEEAVSIDDIAVDADISKVTLRRYLDYLEKTNLIEIEMAYGSRGRPSYRYKKKIFKHI